MSDSTRRPEAEIIPPTASDPTKLQDRRGSGNARVWVWSSGPNGQRLRYGKPGPLGLIMLFATLAALGAIGFFVFLGALAITLPLIGALVLVGVIASALRRI